MRDTVRTKHALKSAPNSEWRRQEWTADFSCMDNGIRRKVTEDEPLRLEMKMGYYWLYCNKRITKYYEQQKANKLHKLYEQILRNTKLTQAKSKRHRYTNGAHCRLYIYNLTHICAMDYYSTIRKKIMSLAGKWIELEIIILNKISQTEKEKYCCFPNT